MDGHDTWDTLLECLKAQPRRQLLTCLAAQQPTETVHFTDVRDHEATTGAPAPAEYVHIHLPKLDAAGYIRWDEQTHEVSQGPRFDEVRPFLDLVQTQSERLPDGWV